MITKKTLTRQSIDELAKVCPGVTVPERAMSTIYGCGNGSANSPFTWDEYQAFLDQDYVSATPFSGLIYYLNESGNLEATTFIPSVDVSGNRPGGSGSGNDSGNTPKPEDEYVSGNKTDPKKDPNKDNTGSTTIGGGGGLNNGGPASGDGASGGSGLRPPLVNKTVMDDSDFVGYIKGEETGCMDRCISMLKKVGVTSKGSSPRINVTQKGVNGRAGAVIPEGLKEGVLYINQSLKDGKPVIVGVDYKTDNYNDDKTTDHFVVIMGVSQSINADGQVVTQYRYFDPATSYVSLGASKDNLFTVTDTGITGRFIKNENGTLFNDYIVTQIRFNY